MPMPMMMQEMIVQMGLREGAKETMIDGRERKVSSSDVIPLSLSNPRLCQCPMIYTQERPPNQVSSLHHRSHPTLTLHLLAPLQMAPPAFLQELAQSQLSSLFLPRMAICLNSIRCRLLQARSTRLRASAIARRSKRGRRWHDWSRRLLTCGRSLDAILVVYYPCLVMV